MGVRSRRIKGSRPFLIVCGFGARMVYPEPCLIASTQTADLDGQEALFDVGVGISL